jgi:DNA transformation protein
MPNSSTPVGQLPNIGPITARSLKAAGICTRGDLAKLGAIDAFRMLTSDQPQAHINLLFALHGALHDMSWNRLSEETRIELRKAAGVE